MGSDLVSAEEARGLLAGATPGHLAVTNGIGGSAAPTVSRLPTDTSHATKPIAWGCATVGDARLFAAAPALARTVVALSGERDEARRERDRLRDIVACERGEWAPEGWVRDSKFDHNWSNPRTDMRADEIEPGRWQAYRWSGQHDLPVGDETPTALEAIEQADKAAGVERG